MNVLYFIVTLSELNYRDLSGFYKKSEAGGGPPGSNEGKMTVSIFNILSE